MKRRTFIQALATAATFILSPFRAKGAAKVPATAAVATKHHSCVYVYNPGIDLVGVQDYTFGRLSVIRGGEVTRITEGEEWLAKEPVQYELHSAGWWINDKVPRKGWQPIINETRARAIREGYYRIEEVETAGTYPVLEPRYVVTHPAHEVLYSIQCCRDLLSRSLVHIKEWDNRPVDLKGVNGLIAGATIRERQRAVAALPVAAWRMTSILKKYLPLALNAMAGNIGRVMMAHEDQIEQGNTMVHDSYIRSLAALNEMPLCDLRRYATKSTPELRGAVALQLMTLDAPPWRPRREYVSREESQRRIRDRAREILSKENEA